MLFWLLATTGTGRVLRDVSSAAGDALSGAIAADTLTRWFYTVALVLVHEAGAAATAYYGGFVIDRRYGLSTQRQTGWWADRAKSVALLTLLACAGVSLVYWTIGVSSTWWWLLSGVLCTGLLVAIANVAPLVLLPLFYRIEPIARESLRARLVALAHRANTRVLGAYEWGLGEKSRCANAAVTGLGAARRILVSDTMLADYSDDEIEVVLAHEIAHHVHGDLWKGLFVEAGVLTAGLFIASNALAIWAAGSGRQGITDIAGLPVILLALSAVFLMVSPAASALSRARERSADRFAIGLTGNPAAFVSAMRRLGAQNLAEEQPSAIVRLLFHTHPPLAERIAAAEGRRQP